MQKIQKGEEPSQQQIDTLAKLYQAGDLIKAEQFCLGLVSKYPQSSAVFNLLAITYSAQAKFKEAVTGYNSAIKLNPKFTSAYANRGIALSNLEQHEEALKSYNQAIKLSPDYVDAYINRGNALNELGKNSEALASYNQAIKLNPANAMVYSNRANTLNCLEQYQKAIDSCQQALSINANFPSVYLNYGNALNESGDYEQAIINYDKAIVLQADYAEAYRNKGRTLNEQGHFKAAIKSYQKAIDYQPNFIGAYNNLCLTLNYMNELSASDIYKKHLEFGQQFGGKEQKIDRLSTIKTKKNKRLKIGYLSADFRMHSVAYFFKPLLEGHHKEAVEIYCYYNHFKSDSITKSLKKSAEHWRDVCGLNDSKLVNLIKKDNIDILVDLSGHTADNRLSIFAYRPAPVQVTWLGYPNTTGLTEIDYRFTDNIADPVGLSDKYYTEKLIRLENGFLCYQGDQTIIDKKSPPSIDKGYITFGSFNNLLKLSNQFIKLWSLILTKVDHSKLIIKSKQFASSQVKSHYLEKFKQAGIDSSRIMLYAQLATKEEHLKLYHQIDVCLDTSPYNGTTTTFEALWMGVPVISLCGESHASRVGASILSHLNLKQYIATSEDEYLQIAMDLAGNKKELQSLHQGLRKRLKESPLMDAKGFTRKIEKQYNKIWTAL